MNARYIELAMLSMKSLHCLVSSNNCLHILCSKHLLSDHAHLVHCNLSLSILLMFIVYCISIGAAGGALNRVRQKVQDIANSKLGECCIVLMDWFGWETVLTCTFWYVPHAAYGCVYTQRPPDLMAVLHWICMNEMHFHHVCVLLACDDVFSISSYINSTL